MKKSFSIFKANPTSIGELMNINLAGNNKRMI